MGLLSVFAITCIFAGTMRAQDVKPDPPFNPALVTIANEPPFFLSDRSIPNPYSDPAYNPKTAGGLLSPLIFTHTTAVHGGLLWKKGATRRRYSSRSDIRNSEETMWSTQTFWIS